LYFESNEYFPYITITKKIVVGNYLKSQKGPKINLTLSLKNERHLSVWCVKSFGKEIKNGWIGLFRNEDLNMNYYLNYYYINLPEGLYFII
jgi:hypothetical protein